MMHGRWYPLQYFWVTDTYLLLNNCVIVWWSAVGCTVSEHLPICVLCSVFGWQSRVAGACCFIISQLCDSRVVSNAWMAAGTPCSISGRQGLRMLIDLLLACCVIVW